MVVMLHQRLLHLFKLRNDPMGSFEDSMGGAIPYQFWQWLKTSFQSRPPSIVIVWSQTGNLDDWPNWWSGCFWWLPSSVSVAACVARQGHGCSHRSLCKRGSGSGRSRCPPLQIFSVNTAATATTAVAQIVRRSSEGCLTATWLSATPPHCIHNHPWLLNWMIWYCIFLTIACTGWLLTAATWDTWLNYGFEIDHWQGGLATQFWVLNLEHKMPWIVLWITSRSMSCLWLSMSLLRPVVSSVKTFC